MVTKYERLSLSELLNCVIKFKMTKITLQVVICVQVKRCKHACVPDIIMYGGELQCGNLKTRETGGLKIKKSK